MPGGLRIRPESPLYPAGLRIRISAILGALLNVSPLGLNKLTMRTLDIGLPIRVN